MHNVLTDLLKGYNMKILLESELFFFYQSGHITKLLGLGLGHIYLQYSSIFWYLYTCA